MNKYSTMILLGLILFTASCKLSNDPTKINIITKENQPLQIDSAAIKGRWFLNKWTSFNVLIFGDKTVFVGNDVDTVFTLNYSVSHDSLITWSAIEKEKFKHKIISLTTDSMVLDGIHDIKEQRTYYRNKTAYN